MCKIFILFGAEAAKVLADLDEQNPIKKILDEGIDFEALEYDGDIATALEKCVQWGNYAFLDSQQYMFLTCDEFIVLSPDGFSIHYEDTYSTPEEAEQKAREWVKNFESQGYYSSAQYGRIPLNEVLDYCRIVPAPKDDDDDDDDDDDELEFGL